MHAGVDVEQLTREAARGSEGERPLTERLAAIALTSPELIAVVSDDVSLSFAALDQLSDAVAASIGSAGLAADACVALLFQRSARFVVAALGVMKSGAAYLPIDPGTPAERLEFILTDAGVELLLTDAPPGGLPKNAAWREIRIDSFQDLESSIAASTSANHSALRPSDLAYVIYTSGSTGEPKGVEITHSNLANLIDWHAGAFELKTGDRASAIAGFGFDAAVWEIWPTLAAGATLHIADEKTRRSPQALRDWLVSEKINVAFVPTVMTEQLMQLPWPDGTSLRYLLTGADTLHRRPPANAPFRVVNNYGPTECTVVATSGIVAPDNGDGARLDQPSIGRAISNTAALILDDQLRPIAAGETGELCLAGAHVGRGYRNRPEMTADRFVTCLVDGMGWLRLYRTGDRAKLLPSGDIAFLGRLDEQVKIRGYRVELGEIASTLDRHPGIEASVVVARDGEAGPELIAYVVPAAEARAVCSRVDRIFRQAASRLHAAGQIRDRCRRFR